MHRWTRLPLVMVALAAASLWAFAPTARASGCLTGNSADVFSFTGGEQCYTVPAGISQVRVVAVGAPGETLGSASGGAGATVSAILPVTPGATLYVEVGGAGSDGQGGFDGGAAGGATTVMGSPTGGGGGGASDLRTCSTADATCNSASSRVLVAGGGGGAGLCGCAMGFGGGLNSFGGPGGSAGSPAQHGMAGSPDGSTPGGSGGGGATQSSGGAAGAGTQSNENGVAGQSSAGGAGGFPNAGGGGGGLFGGGGGAGGASYLDIHFNTFQGGGGGGGAGSSFVESSASDGSIGTAASGSQPTVTITAIAPTGPTGGGGLTRGAGIVHHTVTERRGGQVRFLVDNPNSVSARGRLTAMAILVHAAATATKAVVIGKASFTASAMASVKVTATLSKTARSYLKTHRSLKARVKLVLAAAGISRTTSQPVVIKVFKAKHS